MNIRIVLAVVTGIVLLAGGYIIFMKKTPETSTKDVMEIKEEVVTQEVVTSPVPSESAQVATTEPAMNEKTIAMNEVAMHATEDDCWVAVDGAVYDVTTFVGKHPGGRAILQGCGKDASSLFASKHGQQQRQVLATFKIGTLSK